MKNDGQIVIVYDWGNCQVCYKKYYAWTQMVQTKIGIIHINCFDEYYDKPDTLPEMPDEINFSSPGPPPF